MLVRFLRWVPLEERPYSRRGQRRGITFGLSAHRSLGREDDRTCRRKKKAALYSRNVPLHSMDSAENVIRNGIPWRPRVLLALVRGASGVTVPAALLVACGPAHAPPHSPARSSTARRHVPPHPATR